MAPPAPLVAPAAARLPVVVATVVVALVGLGVAPAPAGAGPAPGAGPASAPAARKVLVVAVPRLTWRHVVDHRPPVLSALLRRGAVASASMRTIGPSTTLGEGYSTIGAGSRATADDLSAGLALHPEERFEDGAAGDAFERRTTEPARGAAVHLGLPVAVGLNRRLLYGARPGALGSALAAAGRPAAVVANADAGLRPNVSELHREAALAVMDRSGRVAAGRVDGSLRAPDPAAPYGVSSAGGATVAAFRDAWARADVVLLEASDLDRADAFAADATPAAADRAFAAALARFDRILAAALAEVDPDRDLVVTIAPAPPRAREQLGVAAVAGPGFPGGRLRSAVTRRPGYVTLTDVAPTVLSALGVEVPRSMNGGVMTASGRRPATVATFDDLAAASELARFRDRATGPVSVGFIVFQVLVYAGATLSLLRGPTWLRRPMALAALMVLAVPSLVFLSGLVPYDRLGVVGFVAALFGLSAVAAAAARALGRGHPQAPPLVLIGAGLAVLLVDVATGGRLQMNTVFGYSPVVAGRFAGFGNLASAIVAISAVIVVTGVWGVLNPDRPGAGRRDVLVAALAFVAVVVVTGAPRLGADVGGVLSTVPAYAVVVLLLARARLSWRTTLVVAAGTVAAIAAFAAADLAQPPESRTHLARLVLRLTGSDGGSGAVSVVERKAQGNLRVLTSSVWTWLIPAALAFLSVLVWRPTRFLQHLQRRVAGLRVCFIGGLLAGVLGFALNDSGVAVPAMMSAVLLPYVTYLLLSVPGAVPAEHEAAVVVREAGARPAPGSQDLEL